MLATAYGMTSSSSGSASGSGSSPLAQLFSAPNKKGLERGLYFLHCKTMGNQSSDEELVIGILLSQDSIRNASSTLRRRIADSVKALSPEGRVWLGGDDVVGVSWIVALDATAIWHLASQGYSTGSPWVEYSPSWKFSVRDAGATEVFGVMAGMHDSRRAACPPALVRVKEEYFYRNASGKVVRVPSDVVGQILIENGVPR